MKLYKGSYTAKHFQAGSVYEYALAVPDTRCETALVVDHDELHASLYETLEKLTIEGASPACVCLGVASGAIPPTREGGQARRTRMLDYDMRGPGYVNFLIGELIPHVTDAYGLRISPSPDMHMICGGSSGGVSAFDAAWYRTDYFRRVYMSSPSFLAMGRGDEMPALIRKCETKPIRVYEDYSENEPDDYFGSSYVAAMDAARALRFANYDCEIEYHPGEGHCSRYRDRANLEKVMRFLWRGWASEPVRAPGLSPRMAKLISLDSGWEETREPFPARDEARVGDTAYYARNGEIYAKNASGCRRVAFGFGSDAVIAVSSDLWRLYAASLATDAVYALPIFEDGALGEAGLLSTLHMGVGFTRAGASDLCVDAEDRVYAATSLGVQAIRSCGLIDAIVPLPGDLVPEKIAFGGPNRAYLYARMDGVTYRRAWKVPGRPADGSQTAPKQRDYYD